MAQVRSDLIAGYTLRNVIGKGGMGIVVKALQHSLDRTVAIKLLLPKLAEDAEFIQRFLREAKTAAKLNHPNIVQVLDAGKADSHYYMVMEYVEGAPVSRILKAQDGRMEEREALEIATKVADALEAAEAKGLVHRDIKPENIMIATSGEVKLCDMGLAKSTSGEAGLTQEGSFVGTPYYISPEQAKGKTVDIRSDIYSLGMTLYHMLSGRRPFEGDTIKVLANQIDLNKKVRPLREINPSISPATAEVARKMTAKRRSERYQSLQELKGALRAALKKLDTAGAAPRKMGSRVHRAPARDRQVGRGDSRVGSKVRRAAASRAAPRPASYAEGEEVYAKKSPIPIIAGVGVLVVIIVIVALAVSGGNGKAPHSGRGDELASSTGTGEPEPRGGHRTPGPSREGELAPIDEPGVPSTGDDWRKKQQLEEESLRQLRSQIEKFLASQRFEEARQFIRVVNTQGKSNIYLTGIEELKYEIEKEWKKYTNSQIERINALVSGGKLEEASRMVKQLASDGEASMQESIQPLQDLIAARIKDLREKEEKEKAASLGTKLYAAGLCEAATAILEGRYESALEAARAKVPEAQREILARQLASYVGMFDALEKKMASQVGEKLSIPLISGQPANGDFMGTKDGRLAFDVDGEVLLVPVALFEPDSVLNLLREHAFGPLARGWFCMQNLWFAQAKAEFKAAKASGEEFGQFFVKLIDENAKELANACLPLLQKPGSKLCDKGNLLPAFIWHNALESLLEQAGTTTLLESTQSITRHILAEVVKKAQSSASKKKDSERLSAAYAAEMTQFAYQCMTEGKPDIALIALEKALNFDSENPYAAALKKRLGKAVDSRQ